MNAPVVPAWGDLNTRSTVMSKIWDRSYMRAELQAHARNTRRVTAEHIEAMASILQSHS